MERIPPPQILGPDGSGDLQVLRVTRSDGSEVSPEVAANISARVGADFGTRLPFRPDQIVEAQQRAAIGQLGQIMGRLGDTFELADLDREAEALKELAAELRATPAFGHLNANGTFNDTKKAVIDSSSTREGRVQHAWVSLLASMAQASGKGMADVYAAILLWVPMVLLANASADV